MANLIGEAGNGTIYYRVVIMNLNGTASPLLAAYWETGVPTSGGNVAWRCALTTNGQVDPTITLRLAARNATVSGNDSINDGDDVARLQLAAALCRNGDVGVTPSSQRRCASAGKAFQTTSGI